MTKPVGRYLAFNSSGLSNRLLKLGNGQIWNDGENEEANLPLLSYSSYFYRLKRDRIFWSEFS